MAHIVMTSQQVIQAATKRIAEILAYRKEVDDITICNAMRLIVRFSWRRGFYRMTFTEAANWLDMQGPFAHWGRSYHAWGSLQHLEKLLKLAKHGDPVTLTEADTDILFND